MNMNDYNKVTSRITPSDRCRNEVLNMNGERKRKIVKNSTGNRTAAIAAAALLIAGGAGITGFHFLTNGTGGPGTDPEPASDVVTTTEDATELTITGELLIEEETTEESDSEEITPGFDVKLDSAECNSGYMIYNISAELPDMYTDLDGSLYFEGEIDIDGTTIKNTRSNDTVFYIDLIKEGEGCVWTGQLTYYLPKDEQFSGTKQTTLRLYEPYFSPYFSTDEEYKISGSFKFDTEIEAKGNFYTVEKDGFSAVICKMDQDMILCGGIDTPDLDGYLKDKGWDTSTEDFKYNDVHPVSVFVDENNVPLTTIPGDDNNCLETMDLTNGGQLAVTYYRPSTNNIKCLFVDKNGHSSPLGQVTITNDYGTDTMEIVAEIPIDLSQVVITEE